MAAPIPLAVPQTGALEKTFVNELARQASFLAWGVRGAVCNESKLTERLSEFNLPVLVITGDDDRIVPTEQSVRLAGELPNAQLVIIEQCGHLPHEERPAEFMQAVTNFLTP